MKAVNDIPGRKGNPFPALFLLILLIPAGKVCIAEGKIPVKRVAVPSHILLVTIDTWRWDHLGVSGSSPVSTPHLDTIAKSGTYFPLAVAPVPLTTPSHASIFTGLQPPAHGVRSNGHAAIPEKYVTLAEEYRNHGYTTAAFVSAYTVTSEFGFGQGFDTFRDELPSGSSPGNRYMRQLRGDKTIERFEEWLDQHKDTKKWFVWIHLYDPHAPYNAPGTPGGISSRKAYGQEVEYVDRLIGRLKRRLANDRNLLWSILSDHGEGLGDHGERRHGLFVYNSTIRVPWIIAGQGVKARTRVKELVQIVDLYPTLLDLAGIEVPEGLDGRSLTPLMRGGKLPARPAYFESLFGQIDYGIAGVKGAMTAELKWIDSPEPELYNLSGDPGEKRNLYTSSRGKYVTGLSGLREFVKERAGETSVAKPVPLDREAIKTLKSLGYLGGRLDHGGSSSHADMDVKEFLPWMIRLEDARGAYEAGEYDKSEKLFREFLGEFPTAVLMANELGMVLLNAGRIRDAARQFNAVLTLEPDDPDARLNLGGCLLYMGRFKKAREQYERVLEKFPDDADALINLGAICYELAPDLECMKSAWGRFVEVAPDDPDSGRIREILKKGEVRVPGT